MISLILVFNKISNNKIREINYMEWREEKILVKEIFEEKKKLDGVILLLGV